MKSFLNFIRKNGLYAFINLFGLTVSLAFVLLLAVFVSRQLTTDAFQKNADRIYLYANENFIGSAYYFQKHMLDHFPEVEKATSYLSASGMSGLGELTIAGSTTAVPAETAQRLRRGVEGLGPKRGHQPELCRRAFSRQGPGRSDIDLQCAGR